MIISIAKLYADLTPDKHTTGAYARARSDKMVCSRNPRAVKWCSVGWLHLVAPAHASEIEKVIEAAVGRSMLTSNDHLGYRFIEILRDMRDVTVQI